MTLLETILTMMFIAQPFGGLNIAIEVTDPGVDYDHVIVILHTQPPTILQFNEDLEYIILEGQENIECKTGNKNMEEL